MSTALEKYKTTVMRLRAARLCGDERVEDEIEETMLLLWDELSEEERLATEEFAKKAFPEVK